MKTFSEIALNEILLSKRTDYVNMGRKYLEAVNTIFNARKYQQMSTFKVNGKYYYCVLIMKGNFLEPHFGVFLESKFDELQEAVANKDNKKIVSLLNSDHFVHKDGETDDNSDFVKIISYVFSILCDFLDKKPITDVKVMGSKRKFEIYRNLVKSNISSIPYRIIKDNLDDEYTDKYGNVLPAKAMWLKYNFS
ncbi:MAG: hypothetical protein ACYDD5_00420 [Sulfuricurvum sp.]